MNDPRFAALVQGLNEVISRVSEMPAEEVQEQAAPAAHQPTHLDVLRRLERFAGQSATLTVSTDDDEGESITLSPNEGEKVYYALTDALA